MNALSMDVLSRLLNTHSLANHVGSGTPSGRRDRLQKLDRPVLTTGRSQQNFGFFKDEWRRYSDAANTTDDNLLRDQLLQCAEVSLRRTLQNTIGSANMAGISVADLLLEIKKEAVEKQKSSSWRLNRNVTNP